MKTLKAEWKKQETKEKQKKNNHDNENERNYIKATKTIAIAMITINNNNDTWHGSNVWKYTTYIYIYAKLLVLLSHFSCINPKACPPSLKPFRFR